MIIGKKKILGHILSAALWMIVLVIISHIDEGEENFFLNLLVAVIAAILFALMDILFFKSEVKRAVKIREKLKGEHTIVCEGWAKREKREGWLALTERELIFTPYKEKHADKKISIALSDITNVVVRSPEILDPQDFLTIKIRGDEFDFEAHFMEKWRDMILEKLESNDEA